MPESSAASKFRDVSLAYSEPTWTAEGTKGKKGKRGHGKVTDPAFAVDRVVRQDGARDIGPRPTQFSTSYSFRRFDSV